MNLLAPALVVLMALAFSAPAHAAPPAPRTLFSTGLHAHEVEPLATGILAQAVQVAVFATCFLALDDNTTCMEISGKARARIEP
jgi:hypothetical protein